jgi:excisionase family DNA binding protein
MCAVFIEVFTRVCRGMAGVFPAALRTVADNDLAQRGRSVLILEAAVVLGVSRRTIYYRIREGRLQTIRTRGGSQRVLWSSIEALLRTRQPTGSIAGEDTSRRTL